MPDWLAAILLGVIEGITEFLPVSSTGHLLLAQHWLPPKTDTFNVIIQVGAMLAVLAVFWRRIGEMGSKRHEPAQRDYLQKLAIAFVITSIGGLAMERAGWKLPTNLALVAWATLIGGIVILLAESRQRTAAQLDLQAAAASISWQLAIAAGAAQILAAALPGTSRSGAVIIVLLLCGIARPAAVEFSFLLGLPTIMAAGGYKLLKALRGPGLEEPVAILLLGTVTAAVTAFVAARWLLGYVQQNDLRPFGWYRIALGLGLLAMLARNQPATG